MANLPMKGPLMRQIFGAATYRATKPTETGAKNLSAPHLASSDHFVRGLPAFKMHGNDYEGLSCGVERKLGLREEGVCAQSSPEVRGFWVLIFAII